MKVIDYNLSDKQIKNNMNGFVLPASNWLLIVVLRVVDLSWSKFVRVKPFCSLYKNAAQDVMPSLLSKYLATKIKNGLADPFWRYL